VKACGKQSLAFFQHFICKVDIINDEKKILNIEVSILGKPTIIELDLAQEEKTED
jgi:transcriptional antiterminator NusG